MYIKGLHRVRTGFLQVWTQSVQGLRRVLSVWIKKTTTSLVGSEATRAESWSGSAARRACSSRDHEGGEACRDWQLRDNVNRRHIMH